MTSRAVVRDLLGPLAACALLAALLCATPALAETTATPWWHVTSTWAPGSNGEGEIFATAIDVGDGAVNSASDKVTVTDRLPAGLVVIAGGVKASAGFLVAVNNAPGPFESWPVTCSVSAATVTCTLEAPTPLPPFVPLEVRIRVKAVGEVSGNNDAAVSGGGAPLASTSRPVRMTETTLFGIEDFSITPEDERGLPDTQAGSHPFQLTSTIAMNERLFEFEGLLKEKGLVPTAAALPKDFQVKLPPGLVGNATELPRCTEADFSFTSGQEFRNRCPDNTAVGVALVRFLDPTVPNFSASGGFVTAAEPVFNLVPAAGEPARFGFNVYINLVTIDTSVRTGEDYGAVTSVANVSQLAPSLSSQVTLWGVPGDPRHDQSRGWGCLAQWRKEGTCNPLGQSQSPPFLTLPTSCAQQLHSTLLADSWREPGQWQKAESQSPVLSGCNQLPFGPSISVEPDTRAGSTPMGLNLDVHVPQGSTVSEKGSAEADVKATTVTLPRGVLLNPSAANGLSGCSVLNTGIGFAGFKKFQSDEEEPGAALFTPTLSEGSCPDGSKIGTVHIKTPLLSHELEGAVYVAAQEANPFGSLVAIYIVGEDPVSGVLVKLAGEITLSPETGQIVSTFKNTPQTPFEDLKLELFGGSRASLTTPADCGTYTTTASFTPWSGTAAVTATSSFAITSGPNGTPCSTPQPFAPGFQAGTTDNTAGAFAPFTLTINRPDADQALQSVTTQLPPGLAAKLSSVTPCPEPQAAQGTCGPESLIGHATSSSGLGGDPFALSGRVYLTRAYKGAPFGLSVVTPAVAGPFNLGLVVVRSTINVDPYTAAVTVTSDPFPKWVSTTEHPNTGIPVQLQQVNVTIDRPEFQFNPTNCNSMAITGTLTGYQGASAAVSSPFKVTNCSSLPFKPTFTASTQAKTSRASGASLTVKVSSGSGQANIGKTTVVLPKALPSRLTTIQKACTAAVFNANPATCPEGSNIGSATVHTPVLNSPLAGPAFLVSHGSAAFPDVEFVLQGEGITLILDGQTNIHKGVTSSTFNALPDAPVSTFETTLPEGPHSALAANLPENAKGSLCSTKLVMPTTITGQNGAVIKQNTKIAVNGCRGVKGFKATRSQLLGKALKACRKKKSKRSRVACEKQARKKYGAKTSRKK